MEDRKNFKAILKNPKTWWLKLKTLTSSAMLKNRRLRNSARKPTWPYMSVRWAMIRTKTYPFDIAKQFGLRQLNKNMGADDDGITSLQVQNDPLHKRYIPYTNHGIHWHTDGYYMKRQSRIMKLPTCYYAMKTPNI